MQEFFHHQSE
jgi:hypothetical protein